MRGQWTCAALALALAWLPTAAGGAVHPWAERASAEPQEKFAVSATSSLIAETWRNTDRPLGERVAATRFRALSLGSPGVESAARWLLMSETAGSVAERAAQALRLAPDLPAAHAAVALARLRAGAPAEALAAAVAALAAIPAHLEARLWFEGSLLVVATAAAIAGGLFFLFLVGARALPDAAHDLGDFVAPAMPAFSRVALLASLVFLPFALGESWAGLGLVLFAIAMAYGNRRLRVAALLALAIFLAGLYPAAERAGRALVALGSDPVARAVYAVSLDMDEDRDRELIESVSNGDPLAALALAVQARRTGDRVEAKRRYREFLDRRPHDPVALVNLGNLQLDSGDTDQAIRLYRRALATGSSATVLFNLAQAHARAFQVADFDRVMAQAQRLDPQRVEQLSQFGGAGFVVDLPISSEVLRGRFLASAVGDDFADAVRRLVAPGLIGDGGYGALALFAVLGLAAVGASSRFEPSSRCRRCGSRICARCDGSVWNGRVCDSCHHLFQSPAATDVERRRRRLRELEKREIREDRIGLVGVWFIPGLGGLRQGRPDRALLGSLAFFAAGFAAIWTDGVVPDADVVGAAGPLALGSLAIGLGLLYVGLVVQTIRLPGRSGP